VSERRPSSAADLVKRLERIRSPSEVAKVARFFKADPAFAGDNEILGVSIGRIFPIAKELSDMDLAEVPSSNSTHRPGPAISRPVPGSRDQARRQNSKFIQDNAVCIP